MKRRHMLAAWGAISGAALSGQLVAAASGGSRFLLVFLRGGYDAANLLVPVSSPFYYEARPNIAIAKPGSGDKSALGLDADWGLHPALQDSVYPLFQQGQAAFIPFAGTDDVSRSHFETQDSVEMGQAIGAGRNFQSGFLNRLTAVLRRKDAISFTSQLPLVMRGEGTIPNMGLRQLSKPGLEPRQSKLIETMYAGRLLAQVVREGFGVRDEVLREMAAEMDAASRNAISANGFELEARRIAKLMRERYSLGFVDIGGWDTHVAQGGANGYLAGRFEELGRGLAAFADEMGSSWHHTVVVVVSEFGRTFRENGNRGTDHGHGSSYWVLGGALHGGRVAGEQVVVNKANLFQNRDFAVLNDYRNVLGGLFARMYGLTPDQLDHVFPGASPLDLGLI